MLFDLSEFITPLPADVQVFASGANRETEIRGFSRLGIPVGVSVNHLNPAAIDALVELQHPVMIDSGAFSEVAFTPLGPRTTTPIDETEWERRLAIYLHLSSALRELATLVVPDKVGDQHETLVRLARYRNLIGKIAASGATLLLPLQVGKMSYRQFYETAERLQASGSRQRCPCVRPQPPTQHCSPSSKRSSRGTSTCSASAWGIHVPSD